MGTGLEQHQINMGYLWRTQWLGPPKYWPTDTRVLEDILSKKSLIFVTGTTSANHFPNEQRVLERYLNINLTTSKGIWWSGYHLVLNIQDEREQTKVSPDFICMVTSRFTNTNLFYCERNIAHNQSGDTLQQITLLPLKYDTAGTVATGAEKIIKKVKRDRNFCITNWRWHWSHLRILTMTIQASFADLRILSVKRYFVYQNKIWNVLCENVFWSFSNTIPRCLELVSNLFQVLDHTPAWPGLRGSLTSGVSISAIL